LALDVCGILHVFSEVPPWFNKHGYTFMTLYSSKLKSNKEIARRSYTGIKAVLEESCGKVFWNHQLQ
jgi:hypothetical protein